MQDSPNYLRTFRKKSPLTQRDVATLIRSIQSQDVCRVEKGKTRAKIELLMMYHLLFNTTVESLFELKYQTIRLQLLQNARLLLTSLSQQAERTRLDGFKVRFLKEVIERMDRK